LGSGGAAALNDCHAVINPLNGEVVAVGHGTTVVMNPKTGQIVQVSASNISTDAIVMNVETGHVVYESH
jgi:co-chaperonin GroES (HSP10)